MQPRPRFPIQGGMGPHPMGPGQMRGPFGRSQPMSMNRQAPFLGGQQMMHPMMQRSQGRNAQGGGILSKLLGGKRQPQGMGVFGGAQAARNSSGGGIGSLLQTLTKPDGLTGFLNNTQQVLQTAQQFGPMIQQYGPLVKNLPAMWRLYKGPKDAPSDDKSTENADTKETKATKATKDESASFPVKENKKKKSTKNNEETNTTQKRRQNGSSSPKLYI